MNTFNSKPQNRYQKCQVWEENNLKQTLAQLDFELFYYSRDEVVFTAAFSWRVEEPEDSLCGHQLSIQAYLGIILLRLNLPHLEREKLH